MLRELLVSDFALIEQVEVEFPPGFTVLTGETGAGKSILIDALSIALGGRAHAEVVREGAPAARVEAVFTVGDDPELQGLLSQWGIDAAGELVLSREVGSGGRSKARVNGRPVTAGQLSELGGHLLEIHGQHEHQKLLVSSYQRDLLDAFAGEPLQEILRSYRLRYAEARQLAERLAREGAERVEAARRRELLEFQLGEIDAARLVPGEEERLREEERRLASVGRLLALAGEAWSLLGGGDSPVEASALLARASERLATALELDPRLGEVNDLVAAAAVQVEEAARTLRRYVDELEADPDRLAEVQERLNAIGRLKAKYGGSVEEVLRLRDRLAAELEADRNRSESAGALRARLRSLGQELADHAVRIGQMRRAAAEELSRRVAAELAQLGMERARFEVEFTPEQATLAVGKDELPPLGPGGGERVQFLLAANPGEPAGELARVASGGELSRVLLALKAILADVDVTPTLIFDEIDAGIGGRTAQATAVRLARLARDRQVICVTHLPQIASAAATHYRVEKETGERTRVRVERLDAEGRVQELARMVGGAHVTETALDHAREMLRLAAGQL